MIGNNYLNNLYNYPDENTGINQLLELLKSKDAKFIQSLYTSIDLNLCSHEELKYLTKAAAIIDYMLQLNELEVPDWLRDDRLIFKKPYYHSKRISDFEKFKLLYSSPAPFSARNVYFDLFGISRV